MIIDRDKINTMPLIIGPLYDRENRPGLVYTAYESLVLQYQTDSDAIPPLLPGCFSPSPDATVRVVCVQNHGVDFLAHHGYRLAAVQVEALFEGEEDRLAGDYVLVMFENMTTPIITGREHLGIHKVYADISEHRLLSDGSIRCEVSLWGHLLFGIDVAPLKRQNRVIYGTASKRTSQWPNFGYKYIPSLDGQPDADYPTVLWNDVRIEKLWLGSGGELYFGDPGEEDIGFFSRVVHALKSLPVVEITGTTRSRGSMVLRYDRCRRLR
jgi:acetoacetate decarboxylase